MKILNTLILAGIASLGFTQEVVVNGSGGLNADSPYNRLYNTRTVTTFKGTISGIQSAAPMDGVGNIITYVVKADNGGTTIVDVGPEWFVSNQKTRIKLKDRVQVTGSKAIVNGRGVIIAEMIVKQKTKDVLTLRAPTGRPYWDAVVMGTVTPPTGVDWRAYNGQIISFGTFADGTAGTLQTMTVRTDNGDVVIGLAPDWFMQRQDLTISPGDMIQVYTYQAQPVQVNSGLVAPPIIYATNVYRGNRVIILRNGDGRPMWYPIN